jgi:hypothetical protein
VGTYVDGIGAGFLYFFSFYHSVFNVFETTTKCREHLKLQEFFHDGLFTSGGTWFMGAYLVYEFNPKCVNLH